MRTMDGRTIKAGRLFRSAQLVTADESDKAKLADMIELIIDFRNDVEARQVPDPAMPGVVYMHNPILKDLTPGISREKNSSEDLVRDLAFNPEGAKAYMINVYTRLTTEPFAVSQYARFIDTLLIEHKKGILWHCSAGKDRAGFATMIVQRLLGVDEDSVMEDYLLTNTFMASEMEGLISKAEAKMGGARSDAMRESFGYLFGAKPEFLEALDEKIRLEYGGFDSFVRDGLGVDQAKRDRLRELYLH